MESEYMALSDAAREALTRKQLFCELQIPSVQQPITILSDSQSALDISENPARYRQAKHIDIRYHAIRHYIHDLKINVDYIPSEHQPADLFTKALGPMKHQRFCQLIGLQNSYDTCGGFLVSIPYNGESPITICIHLMHIGIYKRFFLPHVFSLLNPGNVGQNSGIAHYAIYI